MATRRIRRRTEVTVETYRVVTGFAPGTPARSCARCGAPLVTLAVAAVVSEVPVEAVHRAVAAGSVHHRWTEGGELLVCLPSMARGWEE